MKEEKIGLNRNFVGYIRELKGYSKGRGLQSTEILVYGLWQAKDSDSVLAGNSYCSFYTIQQFKGSGQKRLYCKSA